MNQSHIKGAIKEKNAAAYLFWGGSFFLIFGLLMIAKLANYETSILEYIPETILPWIAGIGSAVGGGYMLLRSMTRRKVYV